MGRFGTAGRDVLTEIGEYMENSDRKLIIDLAERIRQSQPIQKDPQVAELIKQEISGQPDAVYVLAQAVLVQEESLRAAQAKIVELNERIASSPAPAGPVGGGFMSGLFGKSAEATPAPGSAPGAGAAPAAAAPAQGGSSGGGSFLKTAAAATAGVAGGGLLLSGLSSAFGGHGGHGSSDGGHAAAEPHEYQNVGHHSDWNEANRWEENDSEDHSSW